MDTEKNNRSVLEILQHPVLACINEAVLIHDAETGVVTDVNMPGVRMFRCGSRDDVVGKGVEVFSLGVSPYTMSEAMEFVRLAATKGPQRFEWHARRMDNTLFWLEVSMTFMEFDGKGFVVSVIRDISSQKEVADSLQRQDSIIKAMFDAVPAAICLVDGPTRQFDWITPYIEKITGHTPEELLGQTPRAFYADDKEYERVGEAYKWFEWTDLVELEAVFQHKDGYLVDIFLTAVKLDSKVLVCIVDISERKKAAREKLEMERQLFHAQKLESLGILAGGIAHDFSNLLMSIMGNIELLSMSMPDASGYRKYICAIEKAIEKAAQICNQMLAYSGKGRLVTEYIDLSVAVEEMVAMLEVSISKAVTLELDLASDLFPVKGDPSQIGQVIMNLVINASEAIGDRQGTVRVSTASRECDSEYLSQGYNEDVLPAGHYVILEVSDTGCGMDAEVMGRVFDPFFTTKFAGRGLGMAALLGIVRGHKGTIMIDSAPGRGTSIRVFFPKGMERVAEDDKTDMLPENNVWRIPDGFVLLVDDEESLRELGRQFLEIIGCAVITASNGRECVDIFRKYQDEISCVILDLTMPGMGGEDAFVALRKIRPDLPVIMSSGYNIKELTSRFLDMNVQGFLKKPYHLSEMQQVLGLAIGY